MKNLRSYINRQTGLFLLAFMIVAISIFYINRIVDQIAKGEQRLVDLYAKGLKAFVTHTENDANLTFLLDELMVANETVPVILADAEGNPIDYRNLTLPENIDSIGKSRFLKKEIGIMKKQHSPIEFEYVPGFKNIIYYKDSVLLNQLRYFPVALFILISLFILLAYLAFNASRNAEQNRVWVGMAKETAHQLGTPMSSLFAWIEYLKSNQQWHSDPMLSEMEKDVERLRVVTERFSTIGSVPKLKEENLAECLQESVLYIEKRISDKIKIKISTTSFENISVKINKPLFDWVMESLCKNSVDAMNGTGEINISFEKRKEQVIIDVSDTGKGIPHSRFTDIFKPGYTTKKRGWGLGLSLSRRIIENYHGGKIFVHNSEPDKGSTFRVLLNG